jgi:hypothetical protein
LTGSRSLLISERDSDDSCDDPRGDAEFGRGEERRDVLERCGRHYRAVVDERLADPPDERSVCEDGPTLVQPGGPRGIGASEQPIEAPGKFTSAEHDVGVRGQHNAAKDR